MTKNDHPSGPSLHREIRAYLDRTGMAALVFARAAGVADTTVANMLRVSFPRTVTVDACRAFMAAHPDGLLSTPGLQGAAALEEAQRLSAEPVRPAALTTHEMVATALVETPGDLIATVKRRWPAHWAAILAKARAVEASPAEMLDRVIARGLETVA